MPDTHARAPRHPAAHDDLPMPDGLHAALRERVGADLVAGRFDRVRQGLEVA
ncbi:hypothetical protein ACIQWA_09575 [Kitasatospora sp. NPDC098652]|uniref:hypothetical protein n=1 Tax=Kitasatospora sp. NPDC098652 TaxID=3364095 RepID=UPI00380D7566